jgi:hypothetical protein
MRLNFFALNFLPIVKVFKIYMLVDLKENTCLKKATTSLSTSAAPS